MSGSLDARLTDAQNALTIAWETKSHADIDIAITKWASILRSVNEDEEKYHDILSSYASALLLRWKQRHRAEDIDKAVSTLEKAVHIQGDTVSLARYEDYCNLGAAYLDRWEALERKPSDLLMAAERWESAHSIATQIGRTKESTNVILPNLGDVYCFAYSHKFSDISALSRAIERYSSALSGAKPEAVAKLRYKLGKTYAKMFVNTNEDACLRLGHSYLKESVERELSNEEKEDAAMELSNIYYHEYEQKVSRDSLESAVYWARRAVHLQDEDGDPRILRKVASLLTILYKDFKDVNALDGAILCYEHAWKLPGSHQTKDSATYYYNYGTALMRRSSIPHVTRQRIKADLKRAVELLRLAIDNAESDDSLAYEVQLKTAKERHNDIEKKLSVQPYRHDGRRFTMPPPLRSATVPGSVSYQMPPAFVAMEHAPNILESQSYLDGNLDPNTQMPPSSTGGNTALPDPPIGTEDHLVNSDSVFDENSSERWATARHQPYLAVGSGNPSWRSRQLDVEVWAGHTVVAEPGQGRENLQQIFPAQYLKSQMPNRSSKPPLGTNKYVPLLTGSQSTASPYLTPWSSADQTFLSPSEVPLPFTRSLLSPRSDPPSPKRSPRIRLATVSGTDLSAPTLVEHPLQTPRNSSTRGITASDSFFNPTRHQVSSNDSERFNQETGGPLQADSGSATLSHQSHSITASDAFLLPPSESVAMPLRSSLPATLPINSQQSSGSSMGGQDITSDSDTIRPTNLTGRITQTDRFPVDEGGFSSIYKGIFGSTKVAIKVIRSLTAVDSNTLRKRLRREMDVWWKLDHPNVVPLLGHTDDMGPLPSMVSPWYENGNASTYIQKEGLGLEFRLQLLREVSAGLRYLHHFSPPIVHGDLKPGNILIDNSGIAKLCDFGLAHLVSDAETSITFPGNVGTIRYAAPELRCPENDDEVVRASIETDIYSLACITYEFLYQKLPFADKGSIQTIIAAGYSRIPPARMETEDLSVLGTMAPHYWEILRSCWDEMPSKRPNITSFCQHIDLAFWAFAN